MSVLWAFSLSFVFGFWQCLCIRRDTADDSTRVLKLPICSPIIVKEACQKLNGNLDASKSGVEIATLVDALSASQADFSRVMHALEIEDGQKYVECDVLCDKIKRFVMKSGGVLPPSSDVVCFTVGRKTSCEVDVDPADVAEKVSSSIEFNVTHPDNGPLFVKQAPGGRLVMFKNVGVHFTQTLASVARTARIIPDDGNGAVCPYKSIWAAVENLAARFRFYPSSGQDNIFHHTPSGSDDKSLLDIGSASTKGPYVFSETLMQRQVEKAIAQAKVWVGQVISTMNLRNAHKFRQRWFGGWGRLSKEQVRSRVLRTFNFIEKEINEGVHFVYPADKVAGTNQCTKGVLAYVWTQHDSGKYRETTGPVCNPKEGFTRACGCDRDGKMFVYICKFCFQQSVDFLTQTIIHELAHHTGPNDWTYKSAKAKKLLQYKQLSNAVNYEFFGAELVTGSIATARTDGWACSWFRRLCWISFIRDLCLVTCAPG